MPDILKKRFFEGLEIFGKICRGLRIRESMRIFVKQDIHMCG